MGVRPADVRRVSSAAERGADDRVVTVRRPRATFRASDAIGTLLAHCDLFLTLTAHRLRVRYKQSVLGWCWALLHPVALMLIFTLVFGRIAGVSSDGVPYPLFAYSGLLLWTFLATGLANATHSLTTHAQLITKVSFPREILPLTYVAAALFDLGAASVLLLALLGYHGHPLAWEALYALPVLALLTALLTGAAFLLSAVQVRYRDVGMGVPLLLYLWMFSTPIAYPLSAVPETYRTLFLLNPMTGIVHGFRAAILHGQAPDPALVAFPALLAAVLLPASYVFFKRAEITMADVI